MMDSFTPMSVSVCRIVPAEATIAMVPKASGARMRVRSMLRPNRTTCSLNVPAPIQAPPRNTCAFRLSPVTASWIDPWIRFHLSVKKGMVSRTRKLAGQFCRACGHRLQGVEQPPAVLRPVGDHRPVANVPEIELPQLAFIEELVRRRDPDAWGLDRQLRFPGVSDVLVADVELLGQNEVMKRVVHAQRGNGVAFPSECGRPHANVRAVHVKVRKRLVKSQAGTFPQDQHDFVECLDLRRMLEGLAYESRSRRIDVSVGSFVACLAVAAEHAPSGIFKLEIAQCLLELAQPAFRENDVLVCENDQVVPAFLNGFVVRLGGG